MISYQILGLICLAAFWVTAILVAADAWSEIRDLIRLRRRLSGVRVGEVVRGDGEDGQLAKCTFELRGQALDGPMPAVDVSHGLIHGAIQGGAVRFDGDEASEEDVDASDGGTVWLDEAAFAVGEAHPEDFDACVKRAASPRGYRRPIDLAVKAGDRVWVGPSFVSTFAPGPFLARRLRRWSLYLVAHLSLAAAVTALALSAPMDSWVGKLGAALCLAHFLASPPVLRSVRAATRTPEETRRFWTWRAV